MHQNVSYQCDEYKSAFTQKISLQRRIQSVHQNIVLQCEECDSIFTEQVKLDIHMESVDKKKKIIANSAITDKKIVEKSDALAKKDAKRKQRNNRAFRTMAQ